MSVVARQRFFEVSRRSIGVLSGSLILTRIILVSIARIRVSALAHVVSLQVQATETKPCRDNVGADRRPRRGLIFNSAETRAAKASRPSVRQRGHRLYIVRLLTVESRDETTRNQ